MGGVIIKKIELQYHYFLIYINMKEAQQQK